ncbi:MAG TPA: pilin [Candidatus Bathyarchaeia archaeon]|nr:pilin [Candidatus Bathyarchaeia archaeon]
MFYQLILPGPDSEGVSLDYPSGFKFNTVADVINEALKYIFPLAGLILFFMLIAAGFLMLTSAGDEEKNKKASAILTSAVIGFVILFVSFWLIKLLETVFGFKTL